MGAMKDVAIRLATEPQECRMVTRPVEVRADPTDNDAPVLDGYAALFDSWTQIGSRAWGFEESIAPGAFADSLKSEDIRALFNHDSNQVLGRSSAKTATFSEDATGLRAIIRPPDTAVGRDVVALIRRGDVTGMSFTFRVRNEEWTDPDEDDALSWPRRRLLDVQLFEAGPVTFPAYEETSISARDRAKAYREAEGSAVRVADADRHRRLRLIVVGR